MALDVLWALTPGVLQDDPRSMRLFGSVIDWLEQRLRPIGPPDPRLPEIPEILKKMSMVGMSLEELSLETVKMFYNDAAAAGYVL